ncbi:MAG TPA: condensation domain-containing protein [Thermoanaerobaculia bacterium]|jgi:hypothetical protein
MTAPPEKSAVGGALWDAVRSVLQSARLDPPLRRSPTGLDAPLSPEQAPFWCPERPEENGSYLIPAVFRIPAAVDPAALERSLVEIARRHEVLRTAFQRIDEKDRAVVLAETAIRLPLVDLRALPDSSRQACAERLIQEEARQSFRLDRGPLVAFKLLRLGDERHALLATFHHAAFDGWSLSVFSRELSLLYEGFAARSSSPLPEPSLQYADYARWKNEWLRGPGAERQRAYWREALRDLPRRGVRCGLPSGPAILHVQPIPAALVARARALGESAGASLFVALLTAFEAMLHRFSGEEDLAIRSIAAGRSRSELCDRIGCFINPIALRVSFAGDPTCRELLQRVRESALGAFAHAELPFDHVLEELSPGEEILDAPAQILFLLQNFPAARLRLGGREIPAEETAAGWTETPLMVTLNPDGDGLSGEWQGHGVAFDAPRLAALAGTYEAVLRALVDDPDVRLSKLPEGEPDLSEILAFLLGAEET